MIATLEIAAAVMAVADLAMLIFNIARELRS